ncbi:hypothetical protein [Microcoleus anatoxicus]|uniref:vWA-MoxR associated protein N-terminal HTH domain-containing protein n=1 Tax=Microcoleus anatoxicus PTRS2 TaxID=2705321 RepID=A0ABU8YLL7_9CYAN
MTIEEAINLVDNLVEKSTKKSLTRLQQAIIRGVLQSWTYQEIQQNDPIARGYTVGYLSRYVGYNLWKDLTKVLREAEIIGQEERVVAANLWDCIMRASPKNEREAPGFRHGEERGCDLSRLHLLRAINLLIVA